MPTFVSMERDRSLQTHTTPGAGTRWRDRAWTTVRKYSWAYAGSAINGTLVTLLALLAGALGAVYNVELRRQLPFSLFAGRSDARLAGAFWISVVLGALLYHFRQRALDRRRSEGERQLDKTAKRLIYMMRTMPPENFLNSFEQYFSACDNAVRKVPAIVAPQGFSKARLDEVHEAIRLVLSGIATLAKEFDNVGSRATYGANVMIFRNSDGCTEPDAKRYAASVIMCDLDEQFAHLEGVLELDPAMSTSMVSSERIEIPSPDPAYVDHPLSLPIPKTKTGLGGRSRVLPGAPAAFVGGPVVYYENLDLLRADLEKRDLTPSVTTRVLEYFQDSRIRSLASIKLPRAASAADGSAAIGVLNIDCSEPNLLRGAESGHHFLHLLPPFESLLLRLVALREQILASKVIIHEVQIDGKPEQQSDAVIREDQPGGAVDVA